MAKMKLCGTKSLLFCSLLLISLPFLQKCNGKSRPSHRRFVPGSSGSSWRGYGSGSGGVLGGIGGEQGDLSYRSSRKVDSSPSITYPYAGRSPDTRDARHTIYQWSPSEIYSKPSSSQNCNNTCRTDSTCFPDSYICDKYAQCYDGTDEDKCKCTDYIAQEKICDQYKDCPDGADEQNCVYGCKSTEFTCDTHNTGSRVRCIPKTKVCDGYSDCPHGNDEHDCFRLVDLTYLDDRGVRSDGILQKRIDNEWYTVCKTASAASYITPFAEKACEQVLGYVDGTIDVNTKSLSQMKMQMSKQEVNQLKYVRLADVEAKFTVLGACASDTIYWVECPVPKCGGYNNYDGYEESRRRRRRDAEDADTEDLEDLGEWNEDEDFDGDKDGEDETQLIVGGYNTENLYWPFLAAVAKDGEFYCGGTIVNKWYILTAAHCCHGYDKHSYEVVVGMTRRLSWSPYEQVRKVAEIYVHKDYNSKVFANDIALYKLDRPLHFSKYVVPGCLPKGKDDDPKGDQYCKVAGWGDLKESGSGPDHMQEVELPILDKCKETFTRDEYQICAGYTEGGKDACQGDSGGPLLCKNPKGEPVVSGVVSFGRGCARANEAGAYTRISAYSSWIEEVTSDQYVRSKSYPKPKSCSETCLKSFGECLYSEEKCDGKVDCLYAEDELNCTYPILTRNHEEPHAAAPASAYYPPPVYPGYASPYQAAYQKSPYAPHGGVLTRAVSRSQPQQQQTSASNSYYAMMQPQPVQPVSSSIYQQRPPSLPIYHTSGNCNVTSQFQCKARSSVNNYATCIPKSMECDRTIQCEDHSDELDCLAVTPNFRDTLSPSSIMQMNEVKGYVLTKYQGSDYHPMLSKVWTLNMGQKICTIVMNSESATLLSMEAIHLQEFSDRLDKQTGQNIMHAPIVSLNGNNEAELLSSHTKIFGHPVQMSKVEGSSDQPVSTVNNYLNEMMVGFVRCTSTAPSSNY